MSTTTTFSASGIQNREVLVPDNSLADDNVGRDTADVKIANDNRTPALADDLAATDVHLDA